MGQCFTFILRTCFIFVHFIPPWCPHDANWMYFVPKDPREQLPCLQSLLLRLWKLPDGSHSGDLLPSEGWKERVPQLGAWYWRNEARVSVDMFALLLLFQSQRFSLLFTVMCNDAILKIKVNMRCISKPKQRQITLFSNPSRNYVNWLVLLNLGGFNLTFICRKTSRDF